MLDFTKIEDAIKEFVTGINEDMQDKLDTIVEIRTSMQKDNDALSQLGEQLNKAGTVVQDIVAQNDDIIELVQTTSLNDIGDFFDKDNEEETEEENEE